MILDPHKAGMATGITAALCYTIVTLLLMGNSGVFYEWFPALFHLTNFGPMEPIIAVDSSVYIKGLIQSAGFTYLYAYVSVYIYNHLKGAQ